MLTALHIQNFTLVEHLDVDFSSGLTAITGETGTGKSLILDALGMALGDRADTGNIRQGAGKTEVAACFDICSVEQARQWLTDNDFNSDMDECLLRRSLNSEGRSRGYINGQPATMQQLRELGEMLIDIHTQHEHQSLLRSETHRILLDEYASASDLALQVAQSYSSWREARQKLQDVEQRSDEVLERRNLLTFQVEELQQLGLKPGDLEDIEQQHKLLSNAESMQQDCFQLLHLLTLDEDGSVTQRLARASQLADNISELARPLAEVRQLVTSASIELEEAAAVLQHHLDSFEADPKKLTQLDEQLAAIHQLARKHRVEPKHLTEKLSALEAELAALDSDDNSLQTLTEKCQQLADDYRQAATRLSEMRQQAAQIFSQRVNTQLQALGLKGASLKVELQPNSNNQFARYGLESVRLLIATNPSQEHGLLSKIASGGELSRISLAIQVVAAENCHTPTLVFDEVDVGIGGQTANIVGKLLQQLGQRGQAICITHLAQVASAAHQHMVAQKSITDEVAESSLLLLNADQRVEEVARMLGGESLSDESIAHAREIIAAASS